MFVIGIDPHKATHVASVVDANEAVIAQLQVRADRRQRERLLAWAEPYTPRVWAVEGAPGLGSLLAQQLVAAGEHVLDVPPTLSARVRLLDNGKTAKTDAHDARSAAIVALRHPGLRMVIADDHAVILRMLAKRHHDLIAARTQAVCRLHAVLCLLVPGGQTRRLSADRATRTLAGLRPTDPVSVERKAIAGELLAEVHRRDRQLGELKARIVRAVTAANTSVTEVYGVGPIVACYLIGHTGDIGRFPSGDHYARYNASAPIEASSGPKPRHRLNPRGNRQLNHALHLVAVTQIAHDSPGRAYFLRRLDDGKTPKEAMRALKRRISDQVYRRLVADARERGSGRTTRDDS